MNPRQDHSHSSFGAVVRTLMAVLILAACQDGGGKVTTGQSQSGDAPTSSSSVAGAAPGSTPASTPGQDPAGPAPSSVVGPETSTGRPDDAPISSAPARNDPAPGPTNPPPSSPVLGQPGDLLLASGFEREVCGTYFMELPPGCEFGIQGDVEAGAFGARTGPQALRIGRQSDEHMGAIAQLPLPGGHAFIGVAHRVPAVPAGAFPAGGYIQLQQISPTDGIVPGATMDVRFYEDRRLGLALFRGDDAAKTDWAAPVDQWFYVVVEVTNGPSATQRMWVYDSQDQLVDDLAVVLATRQEGEFGRRTAQKVGGTLSTKVPISTYADDWFVSTGFRGPTRIGVDGNVIG